ncbi:glycoside hydrolase superfamily [Absidia repens]|uniref:Probable beta-glucosidase G n=1 Tax=Absidia repens TaxID=90262 RepID=A0A1X2HL44_9FUNG|nr:glycoside hydrolase superfamily [Absidia repens]
MGSTEPLSWEQAYKKGIMLTSQMSLKQKVGIMTGNGDFKGPCIGNTGAVKNMFPNLCMQDGPVAVRGTTGITVGVSGINTAASFDKKAIRQRGMYLGEEFRGKGAHVYLGPDVNMVRTPFAGRNFETFGEDPYLSGVAGVETILGIQSQGVIAQVKHLIASEQETWRESYSSNVGDKALNEVYLWPFEEAINAGVGSIMCSYNKVNGTHACENKYILQDIIKGRLSFKGFITSDWRATHSTVDSANHGLDVNMPGPFGYGDQLVKSVMEGQVTEETINNMALRIVSTWYKFGQDKGYPDVNMNVVYPFKDQKVDVQGDHKQYVRSLGASSTVLLKNQNHTLPIRPNHINSLAIIGTDAGDSPSTENQFCDNLPCFTGTIAMGGGSGSANYPYIVSPLEGIKNRAGNSMEINHSGSDLNLLNAYLQAKKSDMAIVFSNIFTMEALDRNNLNLDRNGNLLIETVAKANENTVVVIHSPNAVLLPWIDHPNIKAVVWAGYPGQETGNSLADILFGDVNPSGRLPYTIAKRKEDYPIQISLTQKELDYTDGVFVGYRHFDHNKIAPLFEFGFGLSYTDFLYSNLTITRKTEDNTKDPMVKASLHLTNTGDIDGAEIVQAYIGFPEAAGEPPKVLRGFEKVFLKRNAMSMVHFTFDQRELLVWNTTENNWTLSRGVYALHIGASSFDIRQSSTFVI